MIATITSTATSRRMAIKASSMASPWVEISAEDIEKARSMIGLVFTH